MLIGITARPCAGQEAIADYLEKSASFAVVRLDAPLRRMLQAGFGITPEQLSPAHHHEPIPALKRSPFQLVNALRWSWIRTATADDTLAAMAADVVAELEPHPVLIPDVCTAAEAALIHDRGGVLIHLINSHAPDHGKDPGLALRDFDREIHVPTVMFSLFDELDKIVGEELFCEATR